MENTVFINPFFEHPLVDTYCVKLGDEWEVGGHIYTIVALSYIDSEVEFVVNYLSRETMTMDEALGLFMDLLTEMDKGYEMLSQ